MTHNTMSVCDRKWFESNPIMRNAGGQNVGRDCSYNSNHMADQACYGLLQLKPGTKAI